MRQHAPIPVLATRIEPKLDLGTRHDVRKRRFRLGDKRPWLLAGPAERRTGRLNAEKANLAAIGEHKRLAIDDGPDHGRLT